MFILDEILEKYPCSKPELFKEQFMNWVATNDNGNVDPEFLRLKQIGQGGDRVVYQTLHPDIILKVAFGPEENVVPGGFEKLYLPYYEFKLPVPIQDPTFLDGRTYGQFQCRVKIPPFLGGEHLPTRKLHRKIISSGCDPRLAIRIIEKHGLDFLFEWIEEVKKIEGRLPSANNWGILNNKPIIFDYGRIIDETDFSDI